jgi:colicin import membrane protein
LEAEKIAGRGERVTARAIRAELGTGSLVTVQKHLVAWKDGQRIPEQTNPNLPPELSRVFLAEVERQVSTTRAKLEGELGETQADRDSITEEAERLSLALTTAEQRIADLASEAERHAGERVQLQRALTESQERENRERAAAEDARRALAVAELQAQSVPELQAKLDAERERSRKAEIEAAELRGARGTQKS